MCHGSNLDCRHIETVDFITILWRRPWEELVPWEPTPWHWSKHVKFRPSWPFQKGCFSPHSCQTAILPHVGTLNSACWALHLSISIHLSNSFSCSMKFFLGLALGESCMACAMTEKNWCPVSTFLYFRGKAFLGKPATITFGKYNDVNSSIRFSL